MLRKISGEEIGYFYENLYLPYIKELKQFGGGDGMALSTIIYSVCQGTMEIYTIRLDQKDIGFLIIEHVSVLNIYRPMVCILEFTVDHIYRGRGVGSSTIKELLEMVNVPIFFVVLKDNRIARIFWEKVVAINGLQNVRPDAKQLKFAGNNMLFCLEKPMAGIRKLSFA